MKPPSHVEVMCEVCRTPIKVPVVCEMAYESPDDKLQVVVRVEIDSSVMDRHLCKSDGCLQMRAT